MAKKPKLALVKNGQANWVDPPRSLGNHGRKLWDSVMNEYDIRDSGGVEMLARACAALDRAESLRSQIDTDGEIVRSRDGIKNHPALKHELPARSFVVRTLSHLGLNVEPIRPTPGRPSVGSGWVPP